MKKLFLILSILFLSCEDNRVEESSEPSMQLWVNGDYINPYTYYKQKHVDLKLSLVLIIFYILGTLVGSRIAVNFSEKKSRINFALLLLLLSIYVFYTSQKIEE